MAQTLKQQQANFDALVRFLNLPAVKKITNPMEVLSKKKQNKVKNPTSEEQAGTKLSETLKVVSHPFSPFPKGTIGYETIQCRLCSYSKGFHDE